MKIIQETEIVEAYREIGNIKKTAKHLRISQHVVSAVLHEAGVVKAKIQPNSSKAQCFSCANAFADRCEFIRAGIDEAEAALQAMGTRHENKIYTYRDQRGNTREVPIFTVLRCKKYRPGSVTE